jgi:2-C-methyl-D-erythritol 4-phosphate cytidylyltransferase
MRVSVIIASAGSGKRFGGNTAKQLILLNRKPILYYCLKVFDNLSSISDICIVTNNEILADVKNIVRKNRFKKVKNIILGGSERQNSIYEGLKTIDYKNESIVLIHDSVRPLINEKLVNTVIKNTMIYGSAIPATPIKDTIKYSDDGVFFEKTIERQKLWSIQTPQGFKYSLILKAHQKAIDDIFYGTDDASLIERMGIKPKIVSGLDSNIKITTPVDLLLAKSLFTHRINIPNK